MMRGAPRLVALGTTVVVLALAFGGCSSEDDPGPAAPATTAAEGGTGGGDKRANTVSIDMNEYAFAISGGLTAGTTTVALRNSGTEMHMASFGLLEAGKTGADVRAALRSGDDKAFASVFAAEVRAPGSMLSPGRSEEITSGFLVAGGYAVICFLPIAGEGAPHFTRGMIATFDVATGGVEATTPEPDARYTVEDRTIDGPAVLKAGETTLQMTSAGKGPHEFFVVRKRHAATTYADVDRFFTDLLDGGTAPPEGYTETSPGIVVASTFDVESGEAVLLTTDLEPGEYLIGCSRAPDGGGGEAAGQHNGEIVDVTVT